VTACTEWIWERTLPIIPPNETRMQMPEAHHYFMHSILLASSPYLTQMVIGEGGMPPKYTDVTMQCHVIEKLEPEAQIHISLLLYLIP
jgi:hypothetical protein